MKKGLKDGYGELVDAVNMFSYNGDWKDDKKHGQGIFKFDSGFSYEGEFENDLPKSKLIYLLKKWLQIFLFLKI